jgi:hypothetical protein
LAPSLADLVAAEGMDGNKLSVLLEYDGQGHIRVRDRCRVGIYDGAKTAFWQVQSLRELFRGNRRPPANIDRYPPEYVPFFFFVERYVLTLCQAIGDRTDQEMEEIFSTLRRRPDGRSLGPAHDFLWQAGALMLGRHVLSQAEFEAVVGQLENSTRSWALAPVSRNYIGYLRNSLGKLRGKAAE